jgi:hypothetical protein
MNKDFSKREEKSSRLLGEFWLRKRKLGWLSFDKII